MAFAVRIAQQVIDYLNGCDRLTGGDRVRIIDGVSQELGERLLHAEAFPFQAALEPRFLLGLLLQLPFGLLALLVARALLRVVARLVRSLTRPGVPREATASWSLPQVCDLPRIPALALGYPQRGPPAL